MVVTPWGSVPSACVHSVGVGVSSIKDAPNGQMVVSYSSGSSASFSSCAGRPATTNGWVETAYAVRNPTTSVSAKWTVPSSPKSDDSQIIYMFPATQNCYKSCGNYVFIIQPVLQWGYNGAFGGAYWVLASWWVDNSGNYAYSTPVRVSAGNALVGTLTSSGCNGKYTCNWAITGSDTTNGHKTTLKKSSLAVQTTIFMTLEVYGVVSCKDYPASGHTTFSGINVNGKSPGARAWTPIVLQSDGCGERVKVNNGTAITLYY
jgi:hypothetical protein